LKRRLTSPNFGTTEKPATVSRHSTKSNMVSISLRCYVPPLILLSTEKQTMAFNKKVRDDFVNHKRARMSVWEAIELLNKLVDESNPDVSRFTSSHSTEA
jgi:hypothetical protein